MKNKDHYSPPEFAELAGVSRQSIYKQMTGGLSEYVIEVGGKKRIKAEALDEYFPKRVDRQQESPTVNNPAINDNEKTTTVNETDNERQSETNKNNESNEASTAESQPKEPSQLEILNKTIEVLTQQLTVKDQQLAVKDQQIKDLNNRLAEASANLQAALQTTKGQQYIHAVEKQKDLEEVRDSTTKAQDKTTAAEPEPVRQDPPRPTRKKSWLARLFS